MGDGLSLHDEHDLVYAYVVVGLDGVDAAFRVSGDDHAAVGQRVGVQLGHRRPCRAGSGIQGDTGLAGLGLVSLVRLAQPTAEVGLEVFGHTAPSLQQLLVGVDTALNVGLVRPEESLHRVGAQLLGRLVVLGAEGMDVVAPEVVDFRAHRVGVFNRVAVDLHVLGQHVDGVGCRREHADALLGGQTEAFGLGAGQVHAGVGLLERLGQHPAGRHVPEFPLVGELSFRLPDLRDHGDGLVPPLPGLPGVYALAELLVGVGTTGAELHPPVGELVDHGGPLGHPDRVVVGQYGDTKTDADVLGALREGAEHYLGAGGAGEAVEEVVLDEPEVIEADFVRQLALFQRLLVQHVPINLFVPRTLHLVQKSKLHEPSPVDPGAKIKTRPSILDARQAG